MNDYNFLRIAINREAYLIKLCNHKFLFVAEDTKTEKEDYRKETEQLEAEIRKTVNKKEKTLLYIRKIEAHIKNECFEAAQTASYDLKILLQSKAWVNEQIDQSSLSDYDGRIRTILNKLKNTKKKEINFELIRCRFCILKKFNSNKLHSLGGLGKDLPAIAHSMNGCNQKENFKSFYYPLMDDILREMRNVKCIAHTPKDNVDCEQKCNQIVSFLMQYGQCCANIKDFEEAIDRNKRALTILEFVFGDEATQQKTYGYCHKNIGWAQEQLKQMKEAASFYKKAVEAYKKVPKWDEKEKSKAISKAQTSYDSVSKK